MVNNWSEMADKYAQLPIIVTIVMIGKNWKKLFGEVEK